MQPLAVAAVEQADLIAFFLPMHTATRLFLPVVEKVMAANPRAHLCGYGLYAPLNDALLRRAGCATVIGGEFEQPLVDLARRLATGTDGAQAHLWSRLSANSSACPIAPACRPWHPTRAW